MIRFDSYFGRIFKEEDRKLEFNSFRNHFWEGIEKTYWQKEEVVKDVHIITKLFLHGKLKRKIITAIHWVCQSFNPEVCLMHMLHSVVVSGHRCCFSSMNCVRSAPSLLFHFNVPKQLNLSCMSLQKFHLLKRRTVSRNNNRCKYSQKKYITYSACCTALEKQMILLAVSRNQHRYLFRYLLRRCIFRYSNPILLWSFLTL